MIFNIILLTFYIFATVIFYKFLAIYFKVPNIYKYYSQIMTLFNPRYYLDKYSYNIKKKNNDKDMNNESNKTVNDTTNIKEI